MSVDFAPALLLPLVPPALAERGVGLRPQAEGDGGFLCELYVSTRWEELSVSGWPDGQKLAFLRQQFALQYMHYSRYYAEAARWLVCDHGATVGRLYLYAMPAELRIVDISLLPSHRGQGIGAGLIGATFDLARGRGEAVTIHVEVFNPARRLYDRLGFRPVGQSDSVYQKMEWRP